MFKYVQTLRHYIRPKRIDTIMTASTTSTMPRNFNTLPEIGVHINVYTCHIIIMSSETFTVYIYRLRTAHAHNIHYDRMIRMVNTLIFDRIETFTYPVTLNIV